MSQLHFYAMDHDLLPVLDVLEHRKGEPLKYVRVGFGPALDFPIYRSYQDIPDLGRAAAPDWLGGASYLMLDAEEAVGFEHKVFPDFERYGVFEGVNPTSVSFSPSGAFDGNAIIYGRFATMGLTDRSKTLYRRATTALKKHFRRVDYAWVGPQAFEALQAGWNLTQRLDAPRELSLKAPEA
ncbi:MULTISPECIES: hypothetical protein [Luteibacter]|uniref:hypothetical protein n=1 Tax=Luteibacter TaxID=242605 RepID=UPI00055DA987|nr:MULTISPECIES: hypothetical protein [unclassified Luteibacter]